MLSISIAGGSPRLSRDAVSPWKEWEDPMSLAEAIKETMNARGLQTAEVARRLGEGYDRATFYRLLNGATTEPRLGTLLGLCRVLEVSPTELLQLAGLWPYIERPVDVLDVRLRD